MARCVSTIYLLCAVVHLTSALTVEMPQKIYEFGRGKDATMQCNFKPDKPVNPKVTIEWSANADNPDDPMMSVLTYYYDSTASGPPIIDYGDDYIDRVTLQPDIAAGTAMLTLKTLTAQDNRTFNCKVTIPGDAKGKHVASTKLVVLVAPSKPTCTIQGKTEFWQNITITCLSKEGTPDPTYKWQSFDTTSNLRPLPLRATDVKGVLSLYNLSTETTGYYVCSSSNKIATETCNVTLGVTSSSMLSTASTAGLIGAAVAALLFLIVLIYCCCCRRKKDEEFEECEMEAPEGEGLTDKAPQQLEDLQDTRLESKPDRRDKYEEQSDRFEDRRVNTDNRQERPDDRRNDRYDDQRSDRYDDRRSDRYDDRRSDRQDDRRSDRCDDRRSDRYDDRRSDRNDDHYDDRRSDRYDDRRNDRYDEPYDDRRYDRRDR
ncbi:glycoprotein A33 (transmembrane), paralog a [Trichomycterus rosablanca]|uniref:glycoprotein A33 (transmembrane), paralog a n=1 Tax=Trichomycterus rosablanca TaxID=2290929 RepID=UPI002F350DA5